MDSSFAEREKRFILAEMIKFSRVDIETLAMFVRANRIEPDWMNMQLPQGRNMNQCILAAERMSIPSSSSMKRRPSNDSPQHAAKRTATDSRSGYPPHAPLPAPTSQQPYQLSSAPAVSILPRPAHAERGDHRSADRPDPPKKRGRPSRQDRLDRSKRGLQPLLPRLPDPQPARPPRFSSTSQASESTTPAQAPSNGLAPLAPKRTGVPALLASPIAATRPITPPEAYFPYNGSSRSPPGRRRGTVSPQSEKPRPISRGEGHPTPEHPTPENRYSSGPR